MESGLKAFFYDYKYYLFPDGVDSLKRLKTMGEVTAKRLKEDRCMAPDFIYESIVTETVAIEDPDGVFEVYVNLYSGEEYDKILGERVDNICHGCDNYVDDGEPGLNGHHREMALSGTCYLRCGEEEPWDLGTTIDWFWNKMSDHLDELAEFIDKNDQKKLNAFINDELTKFFYPTEFYGTVKDGKYTLCISNTANALALPQVLMCIHDVFAHCASKDCSPMKKAGWQVLAYRPVGVYKYNKKINVSAPAVRLKHRNDDVSSPFILELYHPNADKLTDKGRSKLADDAVDYFVSAIGEDVFLQCICDLVFSQDDTELLSLSEAGEKIKTYFEDTIAGEDVRTFPPSDGYGTDADFKSVAYPFRRNLREGVTSCCGMSFLSKDVDDEELWWRQTCSFAYLAIPKQMDDAELSIQTLSKYCAHLDRVPEPLRDPEDSRVAGVMIGVGDCGEDGYVIDHLVVSEKMFFRNLRILAPVLMAYRANVVVVNGDGIMAYRCGYEFTPIDDLA